MSHTNKPAHKVKQQTNTHTLQHEETNSTSLSLIAKDQFHGGENLSLLQKILAASSEDPPWVNSHFATAFLFPVAEISDVRRTPARVNTSSASTASMESEIHTA